MSAARPRPRHTAPTTTSAQLDRNCGQTSHPSHQTSGARGKAGGLRGGVSQVRVTWESSSATAGSWTPQVAYAAEYSSATADRAGLLGAALSFLTFLTLLIHQSMLMPPPTRPRVGLPPGRGGSVRLWVHHVPMTSAVKSLSAYSVGRKIHSSPSRITPACPYHDSQPARRQQLTLACERLARSLTVRRAAMVAMIEGRIITRGLVAGLEHPSPQNPRHACQTLEPKGNTLIK